MESLLCILSKQMKFAEKSKISCTKAHISPSLKVCLKAATGGFL